MAEFVIFTDVYAIGFARSAGAHRIATVLRQQGIHTQVIDLAARMSAQELRSVMQKHIDSHTRFVGISNTFLNVRFEQSLFPNNHSLELIKEFKDCYGFKVILGGNRNSIDSIIENDYLNCIDLIVSGFADRAIIDIYHHYHNLKTHTIGHHKILDADREPYLFQEFDRSQIVWDCQDHIFSGESLPIEIARGCVFRCSYCFFPLNGKGRHDRYLKQETVIQQELLRNYQQFGTTVYDLMDDLVNDSVYKVEMLHRIFRSLPFKIRWTGYARPDLIIAHPHTLDLLNESGCVALRFGIETFNPDSAKAIGKGMHPLKIKQGLEWMRQNSDIKLGASFIAGLPYETKQSLTYTCDWLRDPSTPLHQKQLLVLNIPRAQGMKDKSKLMIDPDRYGYRDLDPDNRYYMQWHNGHFDINYARAVCRDIWRDLEAQSVYISHDAFRLYNIGYDFDYIMNAKMNQIDPTEKFEQFKQAYLFRLLA
jgi:hypothetical protein